jgi:hypothetical protein
MLANVHMIVEIIMASWSDGGADLEITETHREHKDDSNDTPPDLINSSAFSSELSHVSQQRLRTD